MTYIFIGWLLVFINLNLNGFDILSDCIGYALIFAGLYKISVLSEYFAKAKMIAVLMCVLTVGDLIPLGTITLNNNELFEILAVILGVVLMFIPIYLMYLITCGMNDLEQHCQKHLAADKLMRIWKTVLFVTALFLIVTMLLLVITPESISFVLPGLIGICVLIANFAWILCFYNSKKRYESEEAMNCV